MKRMVRSAALLLATVLLCASLCGCAVIQKVWEKMSGGKQEDAVPTPMPETVVLQVEKPKYTAQEQKGQLIAERITDMGSVEVVRETRKRMTLDITAPDMHVVMNEACEQLKKRAVAPEDMVQATDDVLNDIESLLQTNGVPMITRRVELEKKGGETQYTYEYYDALYGGLLEAVRELEETYAGGDD